MLQVASWSHLLRLLLRIGASLDGALNLVRVLLVAWLLRLQLLPAAR
jgi:hypothetical protein